MTITDLTNATKDRPALDGKPNCYACRHRRSISGDAHSLCAHPNALAAAAGIPVMTVKGHPHGIRSGWFVFPFNFDPVWLLECSGFEAVDKT